MMANRTTFPIDQYKLGHINILRSIHKALTLQIVQDALLSSSSVLYFNLSVLCFIVHPRFPLSLPLYVFAAHENCSLPDAPHVRDSVTVTEAKQSRLKPTRYTS